jgi:hypothetical protein
VYLLDVIHEMHVVGAAKNDHAFRGGYSFEDLVHALDRKADVVVGHQNEGRNVAAHLNASFAGRMPGLGFELPPGASATTAWI